ncbi:MAG: hypothetical protein INR69_09635 [Mucilaginibacter polytrichastri]|nr:hypothetical protein [Mucilaginibacter polytrichastri]
MAAVTWFFNRSLIGIDDANIYMVYMRNFAEGHGFVFNTGSERVEGFTSLLWTLIGAAFYIITPQPEWLFLALNCVLQVAALWKIVQYTERKITDTKRRRTALLLFFGMLAVIPGYFEWSLLSYLETGLWSVLLIFTTLTLTEEIASEKITAVSWKFNGLIILLLLCRPESILWAPLFILLRSLVLFSPRKIHAWPALLVSVCTYALTLIALLAWRRSYFGYPFPNTYYAKVTADHLQNFKQGLYYMLQYVFYNPFILAVLAGGLLLVKKSGVKKASDAAIFLVVILFACAIPFYVGGDHFAYFRFIQPVTPLIWLLFILLFATQIPNAKWERAGAIVFLLFASFTSRNNYVENLMTGQNPMKIEFDLARNGRSNCSRLNDFFDKLDKLPVQGVIPAGGTAYAYHGKTIDLLGLNDTRIAHAPKTGLRGLPKGHETFNKTLFYALKPDIFWMYGGFLPDADSAKRISNIHIPPFTVLVTQGLYKDAEFRRRYSLVFIRKRDVPDVLCIYASNDFLKTLDQEQYTFDVFKGALIEQD